MLPKKGLVQVHVVHMPAYGDLHGNWREKEEA